MKGIDKPDSLSALFDSVDLNPESDRSDTEQPSKRCCPIVTDVSDEKAKDFINKINMADKTLCSFLF